MSDKGHVPILIIRKARWRVYSGIAISALGLLVQTSAYIWVGSIVGLDQAMRFLAGEPFQAVLLAAPLLGTIFLLGSSLAALWRGDFIKLTDKGFSFRLGHRARTVRWADVKQFRFERPSDSMYLSVGWDHQDDAFSGNPVWEGSKLEGKRTTTLDSDIGWGWQGGAEKVCSTLEDWRIRHSHSFIPEKERGAVTDTGRGAPDLPSSLTVHADARKSLGPLLVISVCFLGLFALPIWISVRASRGLTFWAGLVGHWNFWLVAAMYAALGLWLILCLCLGAPHPHEANHRADARGFRGE